MEGQRLDYRDVWCGFERPAMEYPVEIKANVEPTTIDSALTRLGLSDDDAQPRSIYFFTSTGDDQPPLDQLGVILRLRRDAGSADATLKFRPCISAQLPTHWDTPSQDAGWKFRIEQDWSGGAYPLLSASLVTDLEAEQVDAALAAGEAAGLFSNDQVDLFAGYTGYQLDAAALRPRGPVHARRWKLQIEERKIDCEEWVVGDQIRFLELSDREDDPDRAASTRQELLDLYLSRGVQISSLPELKTQVVLDYFSAASRV